MILATDPVCESHDPGRGHPEQRARYGAVRRALEESGLWKEARIIGPKALEVADLQLAHDPDYIALAEREIRAGQDRLSTGDTSVNEHSWSAALAAAGCAVAATEAVVKGEAKTAFCVVRPPGHHATAKLGMGFCVLNSVAIAARYARERLGIARVLIVDWDVHHGNGTQDIFYADPSVFFFSTHQSPWYPGTGAASETGTGAGVGTTLNCPLPAGTGRSDIFDCFEQKLVPAMDRFRPELVLVSAGFDSRENDPLGRFRLRDDDFADLTKLLRSLADRSGKGRVVSVLEGGYNLEGLAKAATAHAAALL
jgi:acetoin utilization deacetylase AcuC-like enzyme